LLAELTAGPVARLEDVDFERASQEILTRLPAINARRSPDRA